MARLGRYFVPGQPQYVIQRGIDRLPVFFADGDAAQYRAWLIEAAHANGLKVHAYVLLPDQVHLLATPETQESLPRTLQSLGRRYVRFINARKHRTGTLWEGRYRAAPIDADAYFISCCRYIELSPVRERLVDHARHYPWSSYRAHAEGKVDRLAAFQDAFRHLGRTVEARRQAYRALFKQTLDPAFVHALRAAAHGGWALGDERFRKEIEKASRRRVAPLPRGPRAASARNKKPLSLV
jgi:putative transposase